MGCDGFSRVVVSSWFMPHIEVVFGTPKTTFVWYSLDLGEVEKGAKRMSLGLWINIDVAPELKKSRVIRFFLDLSSDTADRYLRASCALTYYASVNLYTIFTISLLCSLIVIFVLCALLVLLLYNRKGEHIATTPCSIIWERSFAEQSYSNASISAESGE